MFLVFSLAWDKEKVLSPHVAKRNQTSDLWILHSDALPLNLYSEQDHFEVIYDMHPAYCWDQQCRWCHVYK